MGQLTYSWTKKQPLPPVSCQFFSDHKQPLLLVSGFRFMNTWLVSMFSEEISDVMKFVLPFLLQFSALKHFQVYWLVHTFR